MNKLFELNEVLLSSIIDLFQEHGHNKDNVLNKKMMKTVR